MCIAFTLSRKMIISDKLIDIYNGITPFQAAMLTSLLFLYILYLFLKDNDLPPGPIGLPLIGYWPFLNTETCHIQLQKLGEKYGDVFSIRVTGKLFIHLGSIKAVKEAHLTKSENFGGRHSDYSILTFAFKDGVAFTNGEQWKVLRKFFMLKFKEYGMNTLKENITGPIDDILKETIEDLQSTKSCPLAISDVIVKKCLLIIRRILFNDESITIDELQELNDNYSIMMHGMTSTNFLLIGNFAKYFVFPLMPSMWSIKRCQKRIDAILFDVIKRRKMESNEKKNPNLIDCYLKDKDERNSKGDHTAKYLTDKSLVSSLNQFVTDGVLSVGVFISNIFMILVEHPDEQEKIYEEIMEVIGPDRLPSMADKTNLPYTSAFIYEVLRYTDFFPLYPSMECTKETTLQGYRIPKGSITLINVFASHHDPKAFEDPDVFRPSRYLTTENKQRPDLPILFGIGKRSCIGEAFAMNQTFLFLTTIMQNFRITTPERSQDAGSKFWSEEKLKVCAIPRSQKSQ